MNDSYCSKFYFYVTHLLLKGYILISYENIVLFAVNNKF